ncbi:MAG: tRNA 2-selenouridine synthase [Bacteroidetes bacterium]|jgi:tRNA 2-selenouridine synthase|nr:tRNA 2-selenouridine synthase [Bacteroidota bacterium]
MTAEALNSTDFLDKSQGELIVDVRAPIEYFKGHIVNALNIPLFDNMERAEIGTMFKQQGKEKAVTRGLEIVSPKLVSFVNEVKALSKSKNVFVYCFRGGMRSNSFAWLMNTSGLNAQILKGGYKAYRNHILDNFGQTRKMILLGGKTGSGKTDILKELEQQEYAVIDLEKIAHHKGSAFGAINEQKQNPQQVFENELYQAFINKESPKPYILEDESQSIGYNKIPQPLWQQMKQAPIIKLDIPFDMRVQKLVEDYTTTDTDALKLCVTKIAQQLGPLNTKLCIMHLDKGQLEDVARISLSYYDKSYEYKYGDKKGRITELRLDTVDPKANAEKVKQVIDSLS